ncbi:hypothetical protein MBLNU13_g07785t1 [Cladosporium sp. NU13]
MLKSPTRPRAPSAATLRVLYQLAYISSGTAVGIGALCAEERRRRTQIVQKIADNAKRIRQSPRYAHGAAAAAVKRRDFEENFRWFDQETTDRSPTQVDAEAGAAKAEKLENHVGAKMPELPSVVEEEYGRLIEGNHKKSKRRKRNDRPDFVEQHGNREAVARGELDARGDRQTRTTPISSTHWKPQRPRLETPNKDISLKDDFKNWMSYKRPMHYGVLLDGDLEAESRRRKLFHATRKGEAYSHPDDDYNTMVKSFETHHLWDEKHSTAQTISPEALARDVDVFFDKIDPDAVCKMSKQHALRIANKLLRLSLNSSVSLKSTQSLLLWKLGVNELSVNDIYTVAASFQQIAWRLEPEKTMQFYGDLFATTTYQSAPLNKRLSVNIRLHAEALKLDALDEYTGLYEELTEDIHVPAKITHFQLAELLEQECGRLVDRGHLPAAVKLWCLSMRNQTYLRKHLPIYAKLENQLFDAAIKARKLSLCAQILRIKDQICDVHNSHQKDTFIKVCFEQGAVGALRSLFARAAAGGLKNNRELSPQSYEYLCRSFGSRGPRMFNVYYRQLPVELRASVVDGRINSTASALKAIWKSTRNPDHVEAKYEFHLRTATEQYTDADTRPLHIAMIEIELSANRPVKAIEAISRLNEGGTDGTIAMLTALALAKQKDWQAFGRLFEALRQDTTNLDWTPPTKRAYNNALHLFARNHTAEQLSEFLSMSIDELQFTPNQSTWEIFMSSLVSKKAIMLLKRWIEFSDTCSRKARVNAGIAAALMKTWYLDFRHSHVLVIWFCRNLVQAAPSLHGEGLMNVVRETIAFDLRKLHGVNAPWMGPIIRTRQALYEQLSVTFPEPGYIWNGQLYDKGRLMTVDELLPQNPALLEQDAFSALSDQQAPETSGASDLVSAVETQTPGKHDEAYDAAGSIKPAKPYKAPAAFGRNTDQDDGAMATSSSATNPIESSFSDLRPSYEIDTLNETSPSYEIRATSASDIGTTLEISEVEMLERRMVIQLSCGQYDSVVEMYQNSLDAVGLPASPLVLEIAVDASLRINGDRHEAESMMSAARDAGMNIACAVGPLLIDQIRNTPLVDTHSASQLRSKVIEYYRMNELNGLHVKHHVGVHAAHTLIRAGFAQNGVNLLTTILQSAWSADKPLDIVAMSVWLAGYASLGHVRGMHWVITEVLDQEMNIDQGFLRVLRRARRPVKRLDNGDAIYVKQTPRALSYLKQWYAVCSRRREAQMQESKSFGRKLVNLLALAAQREAPRTTAARRDRRRRLLRSERSSPPDSGDKRDLRIRKIHRSSERSEHPQLHERPEIFELDKLLEFSEHSEHSEHVERPDQSGHSEHFERPSPPLSGD